MTIDLSFHGWPGSSVESVVVVCIVGAILLGGFIGGILYGRRQVSGQRERARRTHSARRALRAFEADDESQAWNTRFVIPTEAEERIATVPALTEIVLANTADPEDEAAFSAVRVPIAAAASLRIKYVDHRGRGTYRSIDVASFGQANGDTLLLAHCSLSARQRTFYVSQIVACVDKASGAVVTDVVGHLKRIAGQAIRAPLSRNGGGPDVAGNVSFLRTR